MQFPRLTPFVRRLLYGLFGVYVLELVLENWVGVPVFSLFALQPTALRVSTFWQVATYPLVSPPRPEAVLGFLIGLVFLWLMMAPFEERFGTRRTWQLTLVATLASGLSALSVGLILGPRSGGVIYGVGPILLATIAAFAYSLPPHGMLSLFGVVSMKPVHLIWLVIGFSVLLFLASRNVLDLVADLSAIGAGMVFVKWMRRPRGPRRRSPKPSFLRIVEGGRDEDNPRWLN